MNTAPTARRFSILAAALSLTAAACVCTAAIPGLGGGAGPTATPEPAVQVGPTAITGPATEASPLSAAEQAAVDRSPATYIGPNCFTSTSGEPDAAGERPCTCQGEVTVVASAAFSADGQAMTLERTVEGETSVNEWTRDPSNRDQWLREVTFDDDLTEGGRATRSDRMQWTADGYNISARLNFSDNTTTFCLPRTFTRQP